MDEKIKLLLDDHYKKLKSEEESIQSSRIPGVFVLGLCTGVVLTYSNLLSIACGAIIGSIITVNYIRVVNIGVTKFSDFFYSIYDSIRKRDV